MKKIVITSLLFFTEILFYVICFDIPGVFPGECVVGIAGNNCGYFVVGLTMSDEKTYDLFFYNPNCQLINSVRTFKRGEVKIGNYDQYFVVQTATITELYDQNGTVINGVSYYENISNSEYSYIWENLKIEYERDKNGNEVIYYYNGDKSGTLDINFKPYQQSYYAKMVMLFATLNFMLLCGYKFFKTTPHKE